MRLSRMVAGAPRRARDGVGHARRRSPTGKFFGSRRGARVAFEEGETFVQSLRFRSIECHHVWHGGGASQFDSQSKVHVPLRF